MAKYYKPVSASLNNEEYDRYIKICAKKGVGPSQMCLKLLRKFLNDNNEGLHDKMQEAFEKMEMP